MKTVVTHLIVLLAAALAAPAQVPPPVPAPATTPAKTNPAAASSFFAPSTNLSRFPRVPGAATPGATGAARPGGNVAVPGGGTPGTPAGGNVAGAVGAPGGGGDSASLSNAIPKGLGTNAMIPAHTIKLQEADLSQVLEFYAELTGKTLLKSPQVPANAKISVHNQTALTREEGINALNTILGLNQISMIPQGDKFIKIVPQAGVGPEATPFSTNTIDMLPDAQGVPIAQIVNLKNLTPEDAISILGPYSKLPQSILGVKGSPTLVIRDYAENVKRMLEILERVDVALPVDIEQVVIPIKYALAGEIAGVLSGLGASTGSGISGGASSAAGFSGAGSFGGGGGNMSIGGGFGGAGGVGRTGSGIGGQYGSGIGGQQYGGSRGGVGTFGAGSGVGGVGSTASPGGFGTSRTAFGSRLNQAVNRATGAAGGQGGFVLIEQAQIIPDERSNALLVFADRRSLQVISNIISKLDVVLPQVRIEALILEVNLGDSKNMGVTVRQNKQSIGDLDVAGASVFGPSLLNPAGVQGITNFANGFSYFGRLNDDLNVALSAVAGDSRINVLARPSVVTSTAKPANIFIGETRPYVTGTYYSDFSNAGSRSQYSQLSIGISLNVLPIINQDGLVVMDISQNISQPGDDVQIDGNAVPSTIERNANAYVAVHDRDTIMLGGFISTSKNKSKSGVPYLKDIPGLGMLFRSQSDSTRRVELMVLIRPTVLPTPEIAALHTAETRDKLPGVRQAERDEEEYQRVLLERERRESEQLERRKK